MADDSAPQEPRASHHIDLSNIKNKLLRSELYRKEKNLKNKERRKQREKRKRITDALGSEVVIKNKNFIYYYITSIGNITYSKKR